MRRVDSEVHALQHEQLQMSVGTRRARAQSGARMSRQFGNVIRTARAVQCLTQDDLAALTSKAELPVSRAAIGAIEMGRYSPGLDVAVALMRALNLEPEEVLDELHSSSPDHGFQSISWDEIESIHRQAIHRRQFRVSLAIQDEVIRRCSSDTSYAPNLRRRRYLMATVMRASTLSRIGRLNLARASARQGNLKLRGGRPRLASGGVRRSCADGTSRGSRSVGRGCNSSQSRTRCRLRAPPAGRSAFPASRDTRGRREREAGASHAPTSRSDFGPCRLPLVPKPYRGINRPVVRSKPRVAGRIRRV